MKMEIIKTLYMKQTILSLVLLAFCIGFISCKKDSKNDTPIKQQDINPIVGSWKLVELINISDKPKYLNAILEFHNDESYTHSNNSNSIVSEGNWGIENNYLDLEQTLFGNGAESVYRIMKLDSDSLKLEQHYTLDNKDAYLEYHYIAID